MRITPIFLVILLCALPVKAQEVLFSNFDPSNFTPGQSLLVGFGENPSIINPDGSETFQNLGFDLELGVIFDIGSSDATLNSITVPIEVFSFDNAPLTLSVRELQGGVPGDVLESVTIDTLPGLFDAFVPTTVDFSGTTLLEADTPFVVVAQTTVFETVIGEFIDIPTLSFFQNNQGASGSTFITGNSNFPGPQEFELTDELDLAIQVVGTPVPVPEPTTSTLAMLLMLGMASSRRTRRCA